MAITVGSLNTAQLGPFIPDIADDLGQSVPLVGQAATAFFVVTALGGLIIGPYADHYGHRRVLMFGLILSAISAVSGGLAPNYPILLLTRVVGGLGMAATVGVVFAIASSRYEGEVRLRALSILTGSFALIGIVGIPMLTGLSAWIEWRGAWIFVGLLAVMALVIFAALGPADEGQSAGRLAFRDIVNSYRVLLGSRPMVLLFAGTVFQGVLVVAAFTYNGAYFIDELGLSTQEFGLVAAFGSGAFALGSFAAGKLGRIDRRSLFGVTMMLAGVVFAPAYLEQTGPISAMIFFAIGFFAVGVGAVALIDLLAEHTPTGQATTMVLNESVFSAGAAVGAAAGGITIGLGGFGALAILLLAVGLIGGLLIWRPSLLQSQTAGVR